MHNRRTAALQIQREAAQSGVDNLYARKKRAMRLWNIVILVMRQANGEQYRLFEGFYHGNPGFTEFLFLLAAALRIALGSGQSQQIHDQAARCGLART